MSDVVVVTHAGPVHEVKLLDRGKLLYHTSFNITEHEDGRVLKVTALHGKAPGWQWWKEHAALHFPKAREVEWERLTVCGLETKRRGL